MKDLYYYIEKANQDIRKINEEASLASSLDLDNYFEAEESLFWTEESCFSSWASIKGLFYPMNNRHEILPDNGGFKSVTEFIGPISIILGDAGYGAINFEGRICVPCNYDEIEIKDELLIAWKDNHTKCDIYDWRKLLWNDVNRVTNLGDDTFILFFEKEEKEIKIVYVYDSHVVSKDLQKCFYENQEELFKSALTEFEYDESVGYIAILVSDSKDKQLSRAIFPKTLLVSIEFSKICHINRYTFIYIDKEGKIGLFSNIYKSLPCRFHAISEPVNGYVVTISTYGGINGDKYILGEIYNIDKKRLEYERTLFKNVCNPFVSGDGYSLQSIRQLFSMFELYESKGEGLKSISCRGTIPYVINSSGFGQNIVDQETISMLGELEKDNKIRAILKKGSFWSYETFYEITDD